MRTPAKASDLFAAITFTTFVTLALPASAGHKPNHGDGGGDSHTHDDLAQRIVALEAMLTDCIAGILNGCQGPTGEPGLDGAPGEPGLDGAPGEPGLDGVAGVGIYDCPYEDGINAFLPGSTITTDTSNNCTLTDSTLSNNLTTFHGSYYSDSAGIADTLAC